ncbi:MAG: deoxynucleoside kinase [Bacteroidetes bacterium]|nr:deoxynucleoside kinase [Bacteroidota bacterium]
MTLAYNYIAIEGNIGAGKTTLSTRLAAQFSARLILEQFEDNSFLPKFYEDPERYAFPLELSFLADRYQQLKTQLATQDMFHPVTIADYFIHKSLIFARKTLNDAEFTLYSRLFAIIDNVLPKPDLLVYLYLHVDRLQQNIRSRGRSYEQNIQDEYLLKIQEGYFDYIRQQQGMRILLIDTNKLDFVANPGDYDRLVSLITKEYPVGIHRIEG